MYVKCCKMQKYAFCYDHDFCLFFVNKFLVSPKKRKIQLPLISIFVQFKSVNCFGFLLKICELKILWIICPGRCIDFWIKISRHCWSFVTKTESRLEMYHKFYELFMQTKRMLNQTKNQNPTNINIIFMQILKKETLN